MLYLELLVLLFCYKTLEELTSECCCTDVTLPLLFFGGFKGLRFLSRRMVKVVGAVPRCGQSITAMHGKSEHKT